VVLVGKCKYDWHMLFFYAYMTWMVIVKFTPSPVMNYFHHILRPSKTLQVYFQQSSRIIAFALQINYYYPSTLHFVLCGSLKPG